MYIEGVFLFSFYFDIYNIKIQKKVVDTSSSYLNVNVNQH